MNAARRSSAFFFDNSRICLLYTSRIAGVTDVRTVPWMPSEREHLALSALLEALPEPVLSVDMKSKVDMANPASCQLFGQKLDRLRNHTCLLYTSRCV